ncbi:MAG: tetratricopeptide repeat protein [Coriobacteriia bacterium]|nr:tetratricopeptide repeat protein [Coriobacteriia bacterium]
MRTVVLDTNVLLSNPSILFAYPDAEVIVPETVLGEIDKLKTSRVDPDLRFRGREVSRILFDFSETGSLVEGVDLPEGGRLRVLPLDPDVNLPEGLSTRNADDRILASAYQACASGCEDLTLVTNDLNMLLKAQTYGLKVERRDEGNASWAKRTTRWFQRYKTPLTILAIAIAVFAGVLALSIYTSQLADRDPASVGVPTEFRDQLSQNQRTLLDGLTVLESRPTELEAIKQVADAYYGMHSESGNAAYAQKGITYYRKYLEQEPDDTEVRTDMSVLYFYTGQTDQAIQGLSTVLQDEPEHLQANFNMGIFYWKGRTDYQAAARQFMTVIDLSKTSTDAHADMISEQALTNLQQIKGEAAAAGVTIEIDASYLPGGTI